MTGSLMTASLQGPILFVRVQVVGNGRGPRRMPADRTVENFSALEVGDRIAARTFSHYTHFLCVGVCVSML